METGIVAVWVAVRWLSGGTQLDQDYWQTVGRCSRMTEGGKILETLVFQMTNMAMQFTASLSAVLRSKKRTKLLHISGTFPGDGSHYY